MHGHVTYYNENKGFGFIKDDNGTSFFFHISNVKTDSINKGDQVSFETKETPKGLNAINIFVELSNNIDVIKKTLLQMLKINDVQYYPNQIREITIERIEDTKTVEVTQELTGFDRLIGGISGLLAEGPIGLLAAGMPNPTHTEKVDDGHHWELCIYPNSKHTALLSEEFANGYIKSYTDHVWDDPIVYGISTKAQLADARQIIELFEKYKSMQFLSH